MAFHSFATHTFHSAVGQVPIVCRRGVGGLADVPALFFTLYLSIYQHSKGLSVSPINSGLFSFRNSTWDPSPLSPFSQNKLTRHTSDRLISISGSLSIVKNMTFFSDSSERLFQIPCRNLFGFETRSFEALPMLHLRGGISGRRGRCGAMR